MTIAQHIQAARADHHNARRLRARRELAASLIAQGDCIFHMRAARKLKAA